MMAILTTRWDSAEHLKTEEDIQMYVEACLEEANDDPALIVHAFGVIARARNMSQLAQDMGLSNEGLQDALSPGGNPTFDTVAKVAKALGFKLTIQPIMWSLNSLRATLGHRSYRRTDGGARMLREGRSGGRE